MIKKLTTPYYLYDKNTFLKCINKALLFFDPNSFDIHFALMANNNLELLSILKENEIKVFTSSTEELQIAVNCGYSKEEIVFCSNYLNEVEIKEVLSVNPIIIADSFSQLLDFYKFGQIEKIAIRIALESSFYKEISELQVQRQGIHINNLNETIEFCKDNSIKIIGIHTYIGTNIQKHDHFNLGINKLFEVATLFEDIEFIDIGGGFGYNYQLSQCDIDFAKLSELLKEKIINFKKSHGKELRIKLEPGRSIIASSGQIVCTVIDITDYEGKTIIGVDTNLSNFSRTYIYNQQHKILPEASKNESSDTFKNAYICGNSIKSDDFFAENIEFPKVQIGDKLVISDVGAYGYSMSMNFCSKLKPGEYLQDEDGNINQIRKPQLINDLLNQ